MPSTATRRGVREVMASTTCSYPQGYLLVEVDGSGTTVRHVPVGTHDEIAYAYSERATDSVTSRESTAMASVRPANFPLVVE